MTYLIEQWHNSDECMSDLTEEGEGRTCLNFGPGEHCIYAFVEAESEQDAKESLHEAYRDKARVTPADKVTPEQIKSFCGE